MYPWEYKQNETPTQHHTQQKHKNNHHTPTTCHRPKTSVGEGKKSKKAITATIASTDYASGPTAVTVSADYVAVVADYVAVVAVVAAV